ncbi:MAG: LysM peptidoglycan-binding domain-containing protein [Acidimicrobiales bacterium]|nr:LysM peptidoglycan-binding domain-containing protein [Hyphomonadaceae bacterium]RZV42855.1 MAG: LysM peptidoglycan-binding domain-containing protein [Acidimicrobiales bacterium]
MVIKALLTTGLFAVTATAPVFAQTHTTTTVREAVPAQSQTIVANSKEDLALQEEIRRIRAYNAKIDAQVGISGAQTIGTTKTVAAPYVAPATNTYSGAKIELFEPTTAPSSTVAATTTPTTTIIERQPVAGATSIYTVAEGDTLYNLSKRNCIAVADIQNQNGLADNNIRLGQVLTIPASQCGMSETVSSVGTVRTVIPAPTNRTINAGIVANSYAVLPKDSFYSIGRRYCVSASEIASANGLATSTIIKPGQVLQLPANACVK